MSNRLKDFDLTPEAFSELFSFSMKAHTALNTKDKVRRFDGKTPFFIHPLGAAIDILNEDKLDWETRCVAAAALLMHDIFEDTSATEMDVWNECPSVPENILKNGLEIVRKLTFNTSLESESAFMNSYHKTNDMEVLVRAADVSTNLNTLPISRAKRSIPYCTKLLSCIDNDLQIAQILNMRLNKIISESE
jgi:(p)ppGpp synthase/HD superfamily hydrolase